MLVSYLRAHEMKLKEQANEWKIKTNFSAWLNGVYIQNAIASVFSKNCRYPQKPFEMTSTDENSEDKLKSSEETIKERSKIIHQMINKK